MSTIVGTAVLTTAREATTSRTEWCLRIGAAACFIGHGAFGILTKEAWVAYFGVVGISRDAAFVLMPLVGAVDIFSGVLVLVSPRPIVLWYMVVWGLWTASLRPLAGEPVFETLERAGNYGVPLALLLMYARGSIGSALLRPVARREVINEAAVGRTLLWSTALLLFGHGALQAITRKPLFETLYSPFALSSDALLVLGAVEMIAAAVVVVAPYPALLITIAAWKLATESLFPMTGAPIWEFVERGGSYVAPVALVLLAGKSPFTRITFSRSSS